MAEELTPITEVPGEKDNKKLWIILAIVLVVLCCLCLTIGGIGSWFWTNGDQLLEEYGLTIINTLSLI